MDIGKIKIAKILLYILPLVVSIYIFSPSLAKAGDGTTGLPTDAYVSITIPETQLVLIYTYDAWKKVVAYYYPEANPSNILGIAHKSEVFLYGRYYNYFLILMPIAHPNIDRWSLFEAIVGHELLHIVDFNTKKKMFDPDGQRRKEYEDAKKRRRDP